MPIESGSTVPLILGALAGITRSEGFTPELWPASCAKAILQVKTKATQQVTYAANLLSPSPNFEPTLRNESRECLHSLLSREEETATCLS